MEREPDAPRQTDSRIQGELNLNDSTNSGLQKQESQENQQIRPEEPESSVFESSSNNSNNVEKKSVEQVDRQSQEEQKVDSNPSQESSDNETQKDDNSYTYNPDYPYYSPEQTTTEAETKPEQNHYDATTEEYNYNPYTNDSGSGEGGEPPSEDSDNGDGGDEEEGGGPVKPFLEHLEDLRWTLVKSVVAIILGMLICLVAGKYLVAFLMWPLETAEKYLLSNKNEVVVMLGTNVIARGNADEMGIKQIIGTNSSGVLHIIPLQIGTNTILALQPGLNEKPPVNKAVVIKNYSPIEGIMVALQLALFGGITISFPFVMYFIGQFVLPALKVNEKRILFKAVGFSGGLFLLGVAFCYFILVVFALGATVQFSQWLGFGADEWRADAYISFVIKFMLGMGITFQLPVIILLLVKIGILDYEKLKKFRSYAFVANLTISAVVTPSGDPFTMLIMALPLHLLYEISTFVAWYWQRKELKKAQQESA
ncbi:MAG: twin-arginine translocase subunit TatC [Verrucomicrobiia bacterium]